MGLQKCEILEEEWSRLPHAAHRGSPLQRHTLRPSDSKVCPWHLFSVPEPAFVSSTSKSSAESRVQAVAPFFRMIRRIKSKKIKQHKYKYP